MSQSHDNTKPQADQLTSTKHIVLLDTDIGDDIDDALALTLILQSPEIELKAVTTVFGDTQLRARLAAHLLDISDRVDVPVTAGIATPLQLRHPPSGAPQAAAVPTDAALPAIRDLSSTELLLSMAQTYAGQLTLICIGPLTNIATALQHGLPPTAIRKIVMMGGSGSVPLPEWNVRSDVKAAQIVLSAQIPITLVGADITLRCQLRTEDLSRLYSSTTPHGQSLSRLIPIWQEHRPRWHSRYPYLHDPLAVTALCAPELFRFGMRSVKVLTQGLFQGFMLPHSSGTRIEVVTAVNVKGAREWIMRRLLAPPQTLPDQ
jgi:purine nucleosidase